MPRHPVDHRAKPGRRGEPPWRTEPRPRVRSRRCWLRYSWPSALKAWREESAEKGKSAGRRVSWWARGNDEPANGSALLSIKWMVFAKKWLGVVTDGPGLAASRSPNTAKGAAGVAPRACPSLATGRRRLGPAGAISFKGYDRVHQSRAVEHHPLRADAPH